MKNQTPQNSALIIADVSERPICSHHKKKDLSYNAWHEWAGNKILAGHKQRQCKVCKRWLFKEEMNEGGR